MYASVLLPPGNSRKLQIRWSGPLVVLELVNNAMIKIKEVDVNNPRTYVAHRSKLHLAKKMGQKDTDPLFKLPRLPKNEMDLLSEELEEFKLTGKINQENVIDEFFSEVHKSHMEEDQDDSTSSSYKASSRTKTSEDGISRSSDEFLSFHQSPGSAGSETSTPEQDFTRHFDLEDLEPEVLDQVLQDSSEEEEEEPLSAAAQLNPDPEHIPEELVLDHEPVRATIPESEPEKYVRFHITEEKEQTSIPQESESESLSRKKFIRVSRPVEKKRMTKINPEEWEKRPARQLEGKTNGHIKSEIKEHFKREHNLDKNKGCIPGKTAHREYQK